MVEKIGDKYKVATSIALDVLYLFNPRHVPDGYWSPNGLKSIVGLPFIWRHCAELGRLEVNRDIFGVNAHFFALIKSYDDLIDNARGKDVELNPSDLKNNPVSKHELEQGIQYLFKTVPDKRAVRNYLDDFAQWRKDEWKLYEDQRVTPPEDQTFEWIRQNKINTCGLNGAMAAKLFALYHPHLSEKRIEIAQKSFIGFMLAAQVYDDRKDFLDDWLKGVPNFFNAALSMFPDEQQHVFDYIRTYRNRKIYGKEIVDMASQATKLCDVLFEQYLTEIASPRVHELVEYQYRKRYLTKVIEVPKEI